MPSPTLGSSVSTSEKDIDTRLTKTWTAIHSASVKWKSDLTDKIKRSFFQEAVVLILLYRSTTWTLTKRMEKKLDGNYTRVLRVILNKSWRQHFISDKVYTVTFQWAQGNTPQSNQLYGHLPPIMKTIKARRTRHAGHCWRRRDELIRDVLLWTSSYGRAKAGRPVRTYIQQLCEDTWCSPEDQPEVMNGREEWWERVRDIHAGGTTWWWWWCLIRKVIFKWKTTKLETPKRSKIDSSILVKNVYDVINVCDIINVCDVMLENLNLIWFNLI